MVLHFIGHRREVFVEPLEVRLQISGPKGLLIGFEEDRNRPRFSEAAWAKSGLVITGAVEPGEKVEITNGPLKSMVGVFERGVAPRDRVLILITSVACCARVEVARSAIRAVSGRGV